MLIAIVLPFIIMAALVCYNHWLGPVEREADESLRRKKKKDTQTFVRQAAYLVGFYLVAGLVYLTITHTRFSYNEDYATTTTGKKYSVALLADDPNIYIDRTYYLLPSVSSKQFKNYAIISTANEDKTVSDDDIFTIRIPGKTRLSIFVVHDSRAETPALGGIPDWLAEQGFKYKPGLIVKTTDRQAVYHVYGKEVYVVKDTVCSFGGNIKKTDRAGRSSYSMYFVLVNQTTKKIGNANILRGMNLKQSTRLPGNIDIAGDAEQLPKQANPIWGEDTLRKKIERHQLWLTGANGGIRFDLNENPADSKKIIRNLTFDLVNISHADLIGDSVCLSQFNSSLLRGTELFQTRLFRVDFFNSILDSANFSQAVIRNCRFFGADLRKANFIRTRFDSKTDFAFADMAGAIFEPDSLPDIQGIAAAFKLDSMTYLYNPSALIKLRDELKKAGFDEAQRKITAAIKRRDNQLNPSAVLRAVNDVLFEFTCGYGTDGVRPLLLVLALTYIFFNIYLFLFLTKQLRLTIYFDEVTAGKDEVVSKSIPMAIQIQKIFFFTVVSTFSVGFGEFNFNDWVKRLSGREYTIAASGLTRILMGVQSLLCLFLFALAILIYFGDPFNQ